MHPLPLARFLPFDQRRENSKSRIESRHDVGDRNPDPHRSAPRLARHRHQPAHTLHDLIDAGPVLVWPILTECGNAGEDDARIFRFEGLVVETEPRLHIGTEILDHNVGPADHSIEDRAAFLAAEIERHTTLVAMLVLEIRLMTSCEILRVPWPFDPHHIGAPVRKLAHADRPGPGMRQIKYHQVL